MANVNKREWQAPNGDKKEAWLVRYKDEKGKYRGRTFTRKKEADAFCHKVTVELEQGSHLARNETVTVSELIDAYLENCDQRHKDGRKMSYAHITTLHGQFKRHIRPELGKHKLADLDFLTVERWANGLLRKNRLAPLSVRNLLYMLRVAVDFGIRRGWAKSNIVRDVMTEFRGMKHDPIRTFTRAEIQQLVNALSQRPAGKTEKKYLLLRSFCHLALFCGLRWGEIAALKVEHIRFEENVIEVRHSLARNDELKGPKSKAGVRNVPMPVIVAEGLKRWLRDHYVANDRGLVFRLPDDRPITAAGFHKCDWQPLLKRAGLDVDRKGRRFHFHALRHFCASMMIQQGVPLTDVAELLGHSSYDMTLQVYAHAIMATNKRIEILESIASEFAEDSEVEALALPTLAACGASGNRGQMTAMSVNS